MYSLFHCYLFPNSQHCLLLLIDMYVHMSAAVEQFRSLHLSPSYCVSVTVKQSRSGKRHRWSPHERNLDRRQLERYLEFLEQLQLESLLAIPSRH